MKFDFPNAESVEELSASATKALLQYAVTDSAELDLSLTPLDLLLDDRITVIDRDLSIAARKAVIQRVLTINRNGVTVQTEVG